MDTAHFITMSDLRNNFYKFYTWLSIENNNVKATDLSAPRVRTAPKTPQIDDFQIENSKFSNSVVLNLPYQELNDEYQYTKFYNILHQCSDNRHLSIPITGFGNHTSSSSKNHNSFMKWFYKQERDNSGHFLNTSPAFTSADKGSNAVGPADASGSASSSFESNLKILNLQGNKLKNLSKLKYKNIQECYFQHNLFSSFADLPNFTESEKLTLLDLSDNSIEKLEGLEKYLPKNLVSLNLSRNPVAYTLNYRKNVFVLLPNLVYLDGIPKLASDEVLEDESQKNKNKKFKSKSRLASVTSVDPDYYDKKI